MEINSLYVFSYKVELGSIATYYDYSFSPRASLNSQVRVHETTA